LKSGLNGERRKAVVAKNHCYQHIVYEAHQTWESLASQTARLCKFGAKLNSDEP